MRRIDPLTRAAAGAIYEAERPRLQPGMAKTADFAGPRRTDRRVPPTHV